MSDVQRFACGPVRRAVMGVGALAGAAGAVLWRRGLADARVAAAVAAVGLVLLWRGARMALLVDADDTVVVRGFARSVRITTDDPFVLRVRRSRALARPVLVLHSGRRVQVLGTSWHRRPSPAEDVLLALRRLSLVSRVGEAWDRHFPFNIRALQSA